MKSKMIFLLAVSAAITVGAAELPMSDDYARAKAYEILSKLTLEQKVSLTGGCATMYLNAIPEAGIYREWAMTDCSHALKPEHGREGWPYVQGIDDRSTVLAPLSALAQTWNVALAPLHGKVMGEQCRARGKDQMLGPGVNIARTPLCGRNWEYMSEDPFLNSKLVVPLIKAVQKEGVAATVKHFCLNNQELARNSVDTVCDERTFNEIYLPSFEAAIKEGGSLALMTSYNKVNGDWASENAYLQRGILRDRWGFQGEIVTDWGGQHSTVKAALNGGDLEMNRGAGIVYFVDPFHGGRQPLADAVREGKVPEATVDEMVLHTLWTMAKTGFFEKAQPEGERLTKKHAEVVNTIGDEAIVLAKNEAGVLPLDKAKTKKVVFVGRNADKNQCQLGCSCEGHAAYEITAFKGMKEYLGDAAEVKLFGLGAESNFDGSPAKIDNLLLDTYTTESTDAFVQRAWEVRGWKNVSERWQGKGEFIGYAEYPTGTDSLATRYEARVTAPESGEYLIGFAKKAGFESASVYIGTNRVLHVRGGGDFGRFTMEKDGVYEFRLDIAGGSKDSFEFGWVTPSVIASQGDAKIEEMKSADAVIVFTGTEMGYGRAHEQEGGDRPNMLLPEGHDEEIAKILKMGLKNLVIVNRSASPSELPWADDAKTLVLQPYLGQEAGRVLARMLFGEVNPSGKLCLTWPRRYADTAVAQLGTYNATNVIYNERFYVGYRWYDAKGIEPLFPFGYGRSYTEFEYEVGKLKLKLKGEVEGVGVGEGGEWTVEVKVTNVGKVAGKETVQFYMAPVEPKIERAVKELKGFAKTKLLQPGESEILRATFTRRDFAYYDVLTHRWRTDPGEYEILVGASSRDIRGRVPVVISAR